MALLFIENVTGCQVPVTRQKTPEESITGRLFDIQSPETGNRQHVPVTVDIVTHPLSLITLTISLAFRAEFQISYGRRC